MGLVSLFFDNKYRTQELELRRAQVQHQQAITALDEQRKLRPLLEETYQRFGDPKTGKLSSAGQQTIDDLFSGYQTATRSTVDPQVVKAFKDPVFGQQLLDASASNGMTLGQLFEQGTDASMRAMARLSLQKAQDSREAQHSFANADQPPPAPDTATVPAARTIPTLGAGLQLPGATPSAAPFGPSAGVAPAPAPAPTPPAAAPVPVAAPAPAPAPAMAQTNTVPPAATPGIATPPTAPTPALQAAVQMLQDRAANIRQNMQTVMAKGDPARSGPAITAMNEQLKIIQDQIFKLTSGFAAQEETGKAQVRRTPLGADVLKETNAPVGTTVGEAQDAAARGQPLTMLSPAARAATAATATASGAQLTDIIKRGTVAQQLLPRLEVAKAAALRAGVTGPVATPVKEALYSVANVFNVNPQGQTALQIINSLTPIFGLQLTSQLGGRVSNREFMAGIQSAANSNQTNAAYAITAYVASEMAQLAAEQKAQAIRWANDPAHPGLNVPDKYGKSFEERFSAYVQEREDKYGTIGERAAAAFGISYKDVLKGKIVVVRKAR